MQREREKRERATAKREKRQDRSTAEVDETTTVVTGESELTATELVNFVEAIHKEYEEGKIDLDEFEEKKQALLARVKID